MAARSSFSRFASSRRRSSRSRARNISSRCSTASNSRRICSVHPLPAPTEDVFSAVIGASLSQNIRITTSDTLQLWDESSNFNRASNDRFPERDAPPSAPRDRSRTLERPLRSRHASRMEGHGCNERSVGKLVAKHNSGVEQRLSRIVVLVTALLFVEPVFFGLRHPRHLGLRYHRLDGNKRRRF